MVRILAGKVSVLRNSAVVGYSKDRAHLRAYGKATVARCDQFSEGLRCWRREASEVCTPQVSVAFTSAEELYPLLQNCGWLKRVNNESAERECLLIGAFLKRICSKNDGASWCRCAIPKGQPLLTVPHVWISCTMALTNLFIGIDQHVLEGEG